MTLRPDIDCEEAVRQLAAYLDQELDSSVTETMQRHLDTCQSCYSRAEFERRLKARIRQELAVDSVPLDFRERMRLLMRSLP
ncbi:MAG: zf-HC2 domain-containing protein [Gemmatimonadota bacterium]